MQQAETYTEINTAPRDLKIGGPTPPPRSQVAGQFEDADSDNSDVEVVASPALNKKGLTSLPPPKKVITNKPWKKARHTLKGDSTSTSSSSPSAVPPPSHLQRRISSNTTEATKALLAFAASGGAGASAKSASTQSPAPAPAPALRRKKKTFVVRLEEIKEYNDRHGRVPRRDPVVTDEPWEQNLLSWVQDCRRQFAEGDFSIEKAKALSELGIEGFRTTTTTRTRSAQQDQEDAELAALAAAADLRALQQAAAARQQQQQQQQMFPGGLVVPPTTGAESHPALRALWLKRQQEEARLAYQMGMRRASMGLSANSSASSRRTRGDPDGAVRTDEETYPTTEAEKSNISPSPSSSKRVLSSSDYAMPTSSGSNMMMNESMALNEMQQMQQLQKAAQARQMALEEMHARETLLARETLMREQFVLREQRLAQAMAVQEQHRRMSMGAAAGGITPQMAAVRAHHLQQQQQQQQQGRVMSLLQPVESAPPRPDPMLGMAGGMGFGGSASSADPRINALLQAQMMQQQQRRASQLSAQGEALLRRPSDASNGPTSMEQHLSLQQRRASQLASFRRPSDASHGSNGAMQQMSMDHRPSAGMVGSSMLAAELHQQQQQSRIRKTWDERMKEMWQFFLSNGHVNVQTRGEHRELGRWLSNTRCRLRDGLLPQNLAKEFLAMERWTLAEDGSPSRHTQPPVHAAAAAAAAAMEDLQKASEDSSAMAAAARRRNSVVPSMKPPRDIVLTTPPTQSKVKTFGTSTTATTSPKGKTKRALPKSWHQSFTELQQFKAKFGHCDVKMIVNSPYGLLGKWLASQRSRHKLGQLPADKVDRLRELGCNGFPHHGREQQAASGGADNSGKRSPFRADDEEAEFDQALRRLKGGKEGDAASVASGGAVASDMADAPCSPATREKRVRHSYETRVEHIKAFKEKHGHVKIRLGSADKHEELLARWLASARSRYRGGQFKEERAAELRALGCDGFEFDPTNPSSVMMMGGDAEIDTEKASPSSSSSSSSSRKRDTPARTATPSPAPSMEVEDNDDEDGSDEPPSKKLKGSGKRQSFDDMLKELESYQYVFGVGCSVPKPDGEKGKLGRWLAFQRRQFIAGKLSEERINKLKSIGRKEFNKSALIVRAAERAAASIHIDQ